MADYNARKVEIAGELDKIMVGKFEPWRAGIGTPVAALMEIRSSALNAVVTVLTDNADEDIAGDVEEKIRYGLDNAVRPMAEVGSRIRDLDAELVCWVAQITGMEGGFLAGLGALGLGGYRDTMRQIDVDLKALIATLEGKWATMSEANQRLEKIEAEASAAMTRIVQEQIAKGGEFVDRAAESIGKVTDMALKVPKLANDAVVYLAQEAGVPTELAKRIPDVKDMGKYIYGGAALSNDTYFTAIEAKDIAKAAPFLLRDPAMVLTDAFKDLFPKEMKMYLELTYKFIKETLPYYRGSYLAQVRAYQDTLPNQGSVLVSLSQTRDDVEAFLQKSGLDKLQDCYEAAVTSLDRWVDGQPTSGMKADAKAVRDAVKAMFDRRFQETTHNFEEFVRREQGRFIGTVSADTENALLWTPIWVDRERGIANLGMDARLRAYRDTTMQLSASVVSAGHEARRHLLELPIGMADPICAAFDRQFAEVVAQLKAAAEETAKALEETAAIATPDAVRRDLDRSRLRSAVMAG
jgi:hypothetical protein